eukprot:4077670-Amphidinium_carterae.1
MQHKSLVYGSMCLAHRTGLCRLAPSWAAKSGHLSTPATRPATRTVPLLTLLLHLPISSEPPKARKWNKYEGTSQTPSPPKKNK